ncbi:MAG: 5,6-dimethylbenzimidazole synthase [Lentisphaerales bacterium]|nr:5,6-dimethylbenzimidazole synthase [Lentisphaerales bacterium]
MNFSPQEKETFYKLIAARRDVRSGFLADEIPKDVVEKVLQAAHQAPSVGFLQPWNFILISSSETKQKVKKAFLKANKTEAELFSGQRKELYENLKLEGIMEAPLNICVTCDTTKDSSNQLGRSAQENMDVYSTVCAIQNMWLAARVEGVGMGWVSIVHQQEIRTSLKIPENHKIIAYLCLGYVNEFKENPELETKGWNERLELKDLIKYEHWN